MIARPRFYADCSEVMLTVWAARSMAGLFLPPIAKNRMEMDFNSSTVRNESPHHFRVIGKDWRRFHFWPVLRQTHNNATIPSPIPSSEDFTASDFYPRHHASKVFASLRWWFILVIDIKGRFVECKFGHFDPLAVARIDNTARTTCQTKKGRPPASLLCSRSSTSRRTA